MSAKDKNGVDLNKWEPITTSLPIPPPPPSTINPYLRAKIPASVQLQPDQTVQQYTDMTPKFRILPPQPNAIAGINATAKGVATVIVGAIKPSTTTTTTTASDGLTHGKNSAGTTNVWETDPAYFEIREDFVPYGGSVTTQGQNMWSFPTSSRVSLVDVNGGGAPYFGNLCWENDGTANHFGTLLLGDLNGTSAGLATDQFQRNSFALLENPGWVATWIWKFSGPLSTTTFSTAAKSVYIGMSGSPISNIGTTPVAARPDIFIGVRFDTSASPGSLTLTNAANASGGNTVYTGTITGGANGAHDGLTFTVAGFTTGANNGSFVCVDSTATTLTLANASGVSEAHAATAAATGLNDSFYTFEVVTNPQYGSGARHNKQGQTFVTSVAPASGDWHRLDITCSVAGQVTLTLDGSLTNTFTATVSPVTLTGWGTQVSNNSSNGRVFGAIGTTGSTFTPPFTGGSSVTVSGLTAGNAPLNATWKLWYGDGTTLRFDTPGLSNIANNSVGFTVAGLPSLTPVAVYGQDDTAFPAANNMRIFVDFFSLVWNPNLSGSAPGTPSATKARYW